MEPCFNRRRLRLLANLSETCLQTVPSDLSTGIYYGYAKLCPSTREPVPVEDCTAFPMVMSLGWNPYYKNEKLSAVRMETAAISCLYPVEFEGSSYHTRLCQRLLRP
jgi:hypothetical protein